MHYKDHITEKARTAYQVYKHAVQNTDRQTSLTSPLAAEIMPNLDELYDSVSGQAHPEQALSTRLAEVLKHRTDPLPLVSAIGKTGILRKLMCDAYPPSMHHFAEEPFLEKELQKPGAKDLSFIALDENQEGQIDYTACCVAFIRQSRARPEGPPVILLRDLVASSQARSRQVGLLAFRELLLRADQQEVATVEFFARPGLAQSINRPVMQRFLTNAGYETTDHGPALFHEDGDVSNYVEVTKQKSAR